MGHTWNKPSRPTGPRHPICASTFQKILSPLGVMGWKVEKQDKWRFRLNLQQKQDCHVFAMPLVPPIVLHWNLKIIFMTATQFQSTNKLMMMSCSHCKSKKNGQSLQILSHFHLWMLECLGGLRFKGGGKLARHLKDLSWGRVGRKVGWSLCGNTTQNAKEQKLKRSRMAT